MGNGFREKAVRFDAGVELCQRSDSMKCNSQEKKDFPGWQNIVLKLNQSLTQRTETP